MNPDSRKTEERLRSWLDSYQVQRERLCVQLLPLLGDYSYVAPRRPKGGPDGSRDLQAIFGGSVEVWGAVGFRNSAKDDNDDRSWVRNKFKEDLDAALRQNPDLHGFVFLTNVDLTPAEQDRLKQYARTKGIGHVDIFNREHLRVVLDSTDGWGYRLQFLDLEMSKEEQLAFINKFGTRIESQLERQRKEIDEQLKRLEFFHYCTQPIRKAYFTIYLDQPYSPGELGHFRILLEVIALHEEDPHPTLWLAARDAYPTWVSGDQKGLLFGTKSIAWSRNPDESLQNTVVGASDAGDEVQAFAHLYKRGPFQTLGDLDLMRVGVYVTESLLEKVAHVSLDVNDYRLFGVPKNMITRPEEVELPRVDPPVDWPEPLTTEEQQEKWLELYVKGPRFGAQPDPNIPPVFQNRFVPWDIDFTALTPLRLR